MEYTKEHQKADLNFLIGARYGKDVERVRIVDILKSNGVDKSIIKMIEDS